MTPTHFYVYSNLLYKYVLISLQRLHCPECGMAGKEMMLDELPTNRGEWLLQCECGEQFSNTND